MVSILLFTLFGVAYCEEFKILNGNHCKALETDGYAFEMRGDDVLYITISYGMIISDNMRKGYKNHDT